MIGSKNIDAESQTQQTCIIKVCQSSKFNDSGWKMWNYKWTCAWGTWFARMPHSGGSGHPALSMASLLRRRCNRICGDFFFVSTLVRQKLECDPYPSQSSTVHFCSFRRVGQAIYEAGGKETAIAFILISGNLYRTSLWRDVFFQLPTVVLLPKGRTTQKHHSRWNRWDRSFLMRKT